MYFLIVIFMGKGSGGRVNGRRKTAGDSYDKKPRAKGDGASLAGLIGSAKAEPEGIEKTKTNREILLELAALLQELGNCKGWDKREGKQQEMTELMDALSDVDFALGGKTALMLCAGMGLLWGIYKLRKLGADPTIKDDRERTALDYAEAGRHWSIEESLKAMEKDWQAARNGWGGEHAAGGRALSPKEARAQAAQRIKQDKKTLGSVSGALKAWKAASDSEKTRCKTKVMQLLKKVSDVNLVYRGMTVAMNCAKFGFPEGIAYLHGRGADFNIDGRIGTVQDYADNMEAKNGEDYWEVHELLDKYGARRKREIQFMPCRS